MHKRSVKRSDERPSELPGSLIIATSEPAHSVVLGRESRCRRQQRAHVISTIEAEWCAPALIVRFALRWRHRREPLLLDEGVQDSTNVLSTHARCDQYSHRATLTVVGKAVHADWLPYRKHGSGEGAAGLSLVADKIRSARMKSGVDLPSERQEIPNTRKTAHPRVYF